jgi:uncharacterized protein YecT (DUF1311 family)
MKKPLIAVLALLAAACPAAQAEGPGTESKMSCDSYLLIPLPAEAASIPTPKTWPDCDSTKLYAGIGAKVDFAATRKCAWEERQAVEADIQPKYTVASVLGGSAMLAALYMNGEGVKENLPLAMRFACEAGIGGSFEGMKAINDKSGPQGKKFKYCDYVVSMFDINFCVAYDSEIRDQKRTDTLKALSSRWPGAQQEEFSSVVKAHETYALAHARGETDQGGTIRGVRTMGVEQRTREKFLAAIQSFESGHLPHGTASESRKADIELNLLYRKAMSAAKANKTTYDGAIQPEGIMEAERAWLKYRDQWTAFARHRYPEVSADAWLTLLTTNRAASLRMTLCGIDDMDSSCPKM